MHIIKLKAGDVRSVLEEASRDHESKVGTIDPSRTHLNYNLAQTERCQTADQIKERIRSLGVKRKIKDDAVLACSVIINVPADYTGSVVDYMKSAVKALTDELCDGDARRILQADVHMDEKTPHMHYTFIPIIEKDGKVKLSAKELLTVQKLREFHPHISERMTEDLGIPILLWDAEKCAERRRKRAEGDRSADYVSIEQYKAEQERKSHLKALETDIDMTEQTLNDHYQGIEYVQAQLDQMRSELDDLQQEKAALDAENTYLTEKNVALTAQNTLMQEKLAKTEKRLSATENAVNNVIKPLIDTVARNIDRLGIIVCRVKDETINSLLNTKLGRYATVALGAIASIGQSINNSQPIQTEDIRALKAVSRGLEELQDEIDEYSRE